MVSTRAGRPRRDRETIEVIQGIQRMVLAVGRRVADEDPEQLAELITLRHVLDEAIIEAVAGQRANDITWEAIGAATGTTRQAALMKWGPKIGG